MKKTMKRLWLAAVLTLCVGATASAYDLTVAQSEHGAVGFSVGGTAVTTAEAGQLVTITVTPDEGYSADGFNVAVYARWGEAKARHRSPGHQEVTVGDDLTFTMPEAHVEVYVTYVVNVGIVTVAASTADKGAWYDLSGRRLAGKPVVKGIYVKDGKKVVVK